MAETKALGKGDVVPLDAHRLAEIVLTLHPVQIALYRAIRAHIERHGGPPTIRELTVAVGGKHRSVVYHHIGRLERAGLITRVPRQARSIRLVPLASVPPSRGQRKSA